jgi:ABC-2 type transport system ATP-binding protein
MPPAIYVQGLGRSFRTPVREPGMRAAVRSIGRPKHVQVQAVRDVSFAIEPGERVAFVGPNGAGKSTTIKMLSGILHPSAGSASVLGFVPWRDRRQLGYEIGTVFGQRSRLWLHLPAADAFGLLARVYDIEDALFRRRRDRLCDLFGVNELARKPVRVLSLGERMRCELVACLLHSPRVLFLDEPTIGLDVVAKAALRQLILEQSRAEGITILLTSHDTSDMEQVCDRVLVINGGELLLDRPVADLRRTYLRKKVVTVMSEREWLTIDLAGTSVVSAAPHRTVIQVDTRATSIDAVVQAVLREGAVQDLTVEDPPMDEIVQAIYQDAPAHRAARAGVRAS